MKTNPPTYTLRELNFLIKASPSLTALDKVKSCIINELAHYSHADQAYLLLILSLSMMKLDDPQLLRSIMPQINKRLSENS